MLRWYKYWNPIKVVQNLKTKLDCPINSRQIASVIVMVMLNQLN